MKTLMMLAGVVVLAVLVYVVSMNRPAADPLMDQPQTGTMMEENDAVYEETPGSEALPTTVDDSGIPVGGDESDLFPEE